MKRHVIWLGVVVSGVLMMGAVFTPPLNPPQCPRYATRMPDGSHCIIGANIGAGLLRMAGIFVTIVGAAGLFASLVAALWERR